MAKAKILAADDDVKILQLAEKVFTANGYEVIKASRGQEASDLAKSEKPDLIILDIMMPDMNGAEAATLIKADEAAAKIPIIFLSGIAAQEEPGKMLSSVNVGGVMYKALAKPFKAEDLLREVQIELDKRSSSG